MEPNKIGTRRRRWSMAAGWVILIYSTLYIVRPVCEFLKENTPFSFIVNAVLGAALLAIIGAIFVRMNRDRTGVALLVGLIFLYAGSFYLIKIPEEKIHFVEYGFLAYLVFRAVSCDLKGMRAYAAVFFLVSLVGWGDEGIQYFLPNRFFQWQDVVLNSWSGGLGLAVTYLLKRK